MTPTLFQSLLGASFYGLPESVRALHAVRGHARYAGRATSERGHSPVARLFARITGLPQSMTDVATTVEFETDASGETWRRDFGGTTMQSRLTARDGHLVERLGPMQLRFFLTLYDDAIHWQATGARLFGVLPLPARWFAQVRCVEAQVQGRYTFLVEAALPLVGRVIRYEGWLEPA